MEHFQDGFLKCVFKVQAKNRENDTGKAYSSSTKCAEFSKYIAHVVREELENDLKNCNPLPKPSKTTRTRWIDHTNRAMKLFLNKLSPYIYTTLAAACSDRFARSKSSRNLRICKAIYLDVFAHTKRIEVLLEQEMHNPIKVISRIT